MNNALKTYTIQLEVEGPVFIGSGQKITKKEYISGRDEALIPDFRKMYAGIRRLGLADDFERFMVDPRQYDLRQWMKEHQIKPSVYSDWIAYGVDSRDVSFNNNQKREISTFVRDAYGYPYIPGSSIKGMLRTLLLLEDILYDSALYEKTKEGIRRQKSQQKRNPGGNNYYLNSEAGDMEVSGFHLLDREAEKKRNAVNDIMAAVIVSDSEPLSNEDIVLCQKIDVHPDKKKNLLPLVRECLKPGTIVESILTIDEELLARTNNDGFGIERLRQAVDAFPSFFEKAYRSRFYDAMYDDLNPNSVFLGGGSGYITKTEMYPLFGEDASEMVSDVFQKTMNDKIFEKHKHKGRSKRGVEPHVYKMTAYEGELYEMGRCRIRFEER